MSTAPVAVHRWSAGAMSPAEPDRIAIEEPLEIRVGGRSVAVTMRTPGHERELAAGFLLTEGVIRAATDLVDVLICRDLPEGQEGNVVDALLARPDAVDYARLTRHVFSASSCGLCGKATLDAVLQTFPPVTTGSNFSAALLGTLPARLREAQPGFAASGGLHASALFDRNGTLLAAREDVGRHNALDKLLGWALLSGRLPLSECLLLVSGRVSFELMQKALAAGIPLVAGIGAPSTLAVACAQRGNQTLVGFLKPDRMNVYCGPERLQV
jgi:FdhD protein